MNTAGILVCIGGVAPFNKVAYTAGSSEYQLCYAFRAHQSCNPDVKFTAAATLKELCACQANGCSSSQQFCFAAWRPPKIIRRNRYGSSSHSLPAAATTCSRA